ncbi:MAG: tetratricopeptide repeat protein [Chitinophagales bacterium]|nr:tetratricopeptide repeat protein [Chitinophagales bacterium]
MKNISLTFTLILCFQYTFAQTISLDKVKFDTIQSSNQYKVFDLPYEIADINSAGRLFSDANLFYKRGQTDLASKLLKKAIKKQPNEYEYHYLQAYVMMDLGKYKESVKHAEAAVKLKPNDWKMLYVLAIAKYASKDYLSANVEFSRAIELDPSQVKLYEGRAYVKDALNDPLAAYDDFNLAVYVKPTYINAYIGRAKMLYKLEKYKEALDDFSSVLVRKPNQADALYYRGICWKMLGNIQNACSDMVLAAQNGNEAAIKELKVTCNR